MLPSITYTGIQNAEFQGRRRNLNEPTRGAFVPVAADESKNRNLLVAKEGVQELQEYGSSEWAGCRTKVHYSQYVSCPELPNS
jgi:hypothetical protein